MFYAKKAACKNRRISTLKAEGTSIRPEASSGLNLALNTAHKFKSLYLQNIKKTLQKAKHFAKYKDNIKS